MPSCAGSLLSPRWKASRVVASRIEPAGTPCTGNCQRTLCVVTGLSSPRAAALYFSLSGLHGRLGSKLSPTGFQLVAVSSLRLRCLGHRPSESATASSNVTLCWASQWRQSGVGQGSFSSATVAPSASPSLRVGSTVRAAVPGVGSVLRVFMRHRLGWTGLSAGIKALKRWKALSSRIASVRAQCTRSAALPAGDSMKIA